MKRVLLGAALAVALIPATVQAAGPPLIKSTTFSHVTTSSATLEAEVDPNGRATRYHFEYCATGPCTSVPEGPTEPQIPPTIKATATLIAGDKTIHDVQLSAGSFGKGDLITGPAAIPAGTTVSAYDPIEKTLLLTKAPTISTSGAELTAAGPQRVSFELEGLAPVTAYHFRVLAKNSESLEGKATVGPDTVLTTYPTPQPFAPCPNDAFRTDQPSATLPDCRAYEQASPANKSGQDARGTTEMVRASVDGDAVTFVTSSGIPGGEGGQDLPTYLARRDPLGWSTMGLLPNQSAGSQSLILGWTSSFDHVFETAWTPGESSELGEYLLTTMLSRSGVDGSQTTIVPPTAIPTVGSSIASSKLQFAATSDDGALVLFESLIAFPLIPKAIEGKRNLYIWDAATDTITLAGVLNDEAPPGQGALAGAYDWAAGTNPGTLGGGGADLQSQYYTQDNHVLSAEGTSLYFTAAGSGKLYLRRNPAQPQSALGPDGNCTEPAKACTIEISASQRTPADPAGTQPAAFVSATADGSKAFFMSSEELTEDANTGPEQEAPTIARADLPNGTNENPSFIPATASAIATSGEYIYWANAAKGTLSRAKLNPDGSHGAIEDEFLTGLGEPRWIAVDSEYVYWTEVGAKEGKGEGSIGRAKLDGSELPEQGFIKDLTEPQGIAVNADHIYWSSNGQGGGQAGSIGRADLTGDDVRPDWYSLASSFEVQGLALSHADLFVTGNSEPALSLLYRVDLNGTTSSAIFLEDVMTQNGHTESQSSLLRGVTLDAGHIYWAARKGARIGRATLDLEEVDKDFITARGNLKSLTSDSEHLYWTVNGEPQPSPGRDLYRYDTNDGQLADLTPDSTDENGAEVRGVLGTSADGSHVYFAANGVLAPDAAPGDCQGTVEDETGTCNLYLARPDPSAPIDVETVFIARVFGTDRDNWRPKNATTNNLAPRTARVSPDGRTLLFASTRKLTPYDNHGVAELYRYRLGQSDLNCVSCSPSGAPPRGETRPESRLNLSFLFPSSPTPVLTRNLSASGDQVFFSTTESLLPEDTNGDHGCPEAGSHGGGLYPSCLDVYEWEADGAGSCDSNFENGGCLYLLSPPNSPGASFFGDASASGDDVFIFSRSPLVGQDQDQLLDVYDARIGGGLAAQNEPSPVVCEAEGCKPGPASPPPPLPCGSACLSGPGNTKPACPKSKVRKGGKCVKKKTHKKRVRRQRSHKHGGNR